MKELIRPYLNDYLYGNTEGKTIALLLNTSIDTVNGHLKQLTQDIIDNFNNKPKEINKSKTDNTVNELLNLYEVGEFKDKDFTIKDWCLMSDLEREPYLITELAY